MENSKNNKEDQMKHLKKIFVLTGLLILTIAIDFFLLFWETIKRYKIFPGS